jgi:hypothetical protein
MATRFIASVPNAAAVADAISALPGVCGIVYQEDVQAIVLIDAAGNQQTLGAGGTPAGIGLAHNKLIVGSSGNVGTAVTQSGDVSMSDTGVFAIGAKKVLSTMLADSVLHVDEVDLSAADIIALHASPKTIVSAPGAGKAVVIDSIIFSMTYGTTQFTGGGVVQAQYHTDTANLLNSTVSDTSIKAAASFAVQIGRASTASGVVLLGNLAVELIAASANFAAGDSTAKVFVAYRIVTL